MDPCAGAAPSRPAARWRRSSPTSSVMFSRCEKYEKAVQQLLELALELRRGGGGGLAAEGDALAAPRSPRRPAAGAARPPAPRRRGR